MDLGVLDIIVAFCVLFRVRDSLSYLMCHFELSVKVCLPLSLLFREADICMARVAWIYFRQI